MRRLWEVTPVGFVVVFCPSSIFLGEMRSSSAAGSVNCRRRLNQADYIDFPPKQNGSTHAVREQRHGTPLDINSANRRQGSPRCERIWLSQRCRLAPSRPILGVYLTCMGMCGSGRATGLINPIMSRVRLRTRAVQRQELTTCCEEAAPRWRQSGADRLREVRLCSTRRLTTLIMRSDGMVI